MRPKVVLSVVAFSLLLIIAFAWLKSPSHRNPTVGDSEEAGLAGNSAAHATNADVQAGRSKNSKRIETASAQPPDGTLATPAPQSTKQSAESDEEKHAAMVEKRASELMDLAMSDDPNSLDQIISELSNSDTEIRKAAVEAVKQFGSTNAIPRLNELASRASDTSERLELEEAIEFLSTPSLTAAPANPADARQTPPTIIKPTKWGNRPVTASNRVPPS